MFCLLQLNAQRCSGLFRRLRRRQSSSTAILLSSSSAWPRSLACRIALADLRKQLSSSHHERDNLPCLLLQLRLLLLLPDRVRPRLVIQCHAPLCVLLLLRQLLLHCNLLQLLLLEHCSLLKLKLLPLLHLLLGYLPEAEGML